ncbi:membrane hypothetical protein [Gammaproteobacteria bacterium]
MTKLIMSSDHVTPDFVKQNYYRFLFVVLCVMLIEVACFRNLPELLQWLLIGGSSDTPLIIAGLRQSAELLVYDLIRNAVIAGFVWLIIFGEELYQARQCFFSMAPLSASFLKRDIFFHVLGLSSLIFFRSQIYGYVIPQILDNSWLVIGYGTAFVGFGLSTLRLWAPFGFWLDYLNNHRARIASVFVPCLAITIGSAFGLTLNTLEQTYVDFFFSVTAITVVGLLQLWGYQVQVDISMNQIVVNDFDIEVGFPCLGYEGMSLALITLSMSLYINRKNFRFPAALLIFPLVLVALFVANCFRIASLIAIGASWSPAIAINGFHSIAGWLNLLLILALAIFALNRFSFFSQRPSTFTLELSAEKIQLLPQVVLIAVGLLSLLTNPGFDWVYPLRVIIVGSLLCILWSRLGLEKITRHGFPIMVGIVVFMVWLALVPELPEKSAQFSGVLFSAPLWISIGWMVFRIIGAILIVPLAEELAFRGYLFSALEKNEFELSGIMLRMHGKKLLALIATSIGFGLLHSAWLAGTVAGLGFGLVKLYRNRLTDAVIAHGITNGLLVIYVVHSHYWSLW